MEGDDVGTATFEDFVERGHEGFLGWVVGPEAEDAAGFDFFGEFSKSFGGVEFGVVLCEEVGGGMVDIEEDGVELLNFGGVAFVERELKKVTEDVTAARVVVEAFAEGDEFLFVPFDDRFEVIDDAEGAHGIVLQGRPGGVAQSEAAHHDVEFLVREGFFYCGDPEIGEFLLDHGEEGGHQEGVPEDDLVDFLVLQREHGAFP